MREILLFDDLSEKSGLDTAASEAANSFDKDDKDADISEAGDAWPFIMKLSLSRDF